MVNCKQKYSSTCNMTNLFEFQTRLDVIDEITKFIRRIVSIHRYDLSPGK